MNMEDRSVFHLISDVTLEKGISCVLIGGFAVNFYKVSRATADVDFLITKEGLGRIAGSLERAGYKKSFSHENFAQFKSNRLSLMDLDFVFVDPGTLGKILEEGERIKIVGRTFIVPSLYHLIALKLHAVKNNLRPRLVKDIPDIVNLMRINKIKINDAKFKEICRTYGSDEVYERIKEAL